MSLEPVHVVGAGLAGSEAAWQLARRGIPVVIHEMRPVRMTPAHLTEGAAELVCSNTFGSMLERSAPGEFKREIRLLGSLTMACADEAYVPAGMALAVDRHRFSAAVERRLSELPNVTIRREEVTELPGPDGGDWIVATGPLGSDSLMSSLEELLGTGPLAFFDAIAPIVDAASLDPEVVFRADRYDKQERTADLDADEQGDYLNVPLNKEEYERFVDDLLAADRVVPKPFENLRPFEGCMPIEELAGRGRDTLRFGCMKPVGLTDPRTGKRPWAVLQLRRETRDGTAYNMVGFQTRLRYPEQKRVFGSLPGFANAEWHRMGSVHRNTFICAPRVLDAALRVKARPNVRVAGQLCGCEGYTESSAMGLWTALSLVAERQGRTLEPPPRESILGALLAYLRECEPKRFQPMNVNLGLVPAMENAPRKRRERRAALTARAWEHFRGWARDHGVAELTESEVAPGPPAADPRPAAAEA